MIKFVVGLGNPAAKFEDTPHNLGRALVEGLAREQKLSFNEEGSFLRTKSDPSYVILKTFMNNSGAAVRDLLQKAACTPEEILVCYDDFDLAVGTLRIRKKGSPGTHNGMKSITECLATENFPRLRLGCGPADGDPADYVLRPIAKSQQKDYEAMLDRAALALEAIVKDGLEKAMNGFNAK